MGAFIERPEVWTGSHPKAKRKESPCRGAADNPAEIPEVNPRSLARRKRIGDCRCLLIPKFPVKTRSAVSRLMLAAFVAAMSAHAADKPFKPSEAKTSKPDLLGQTRTELRDARGQKVGEAITTKPNLLGETRTTLRDSSGKTLGEAVTRKPNLLGESKTTFKDPTGHRLGEAVTTKPDLLGQTKTTFKDPSGHRLGEAVTTKPGLLGETKTTIKGGTPWNPSTSSGKSSTTLPTTTKR